MVAYSFKSRFEPLIESGQKTHTIRAPRRRHARPGEEVQLYRAMRTRQCRLIGRAPCTAVYPVTIGYEGLLLKVDVDGLRIIDLNGFARRDGFQDSADFEAFWVDTHAIAPDGPTFEGVLIAWGALR